MNKSYFGLALFGILLGSIAILAISQSCDHSPPPVPQDTGVLPNLDGKIDSDFWTQGGTTIGDAPFPIDPNLDPNVKNADGVGLDENGDLVLNHKKINFNYLWISNTDDLNRGTISKVDTDALMEVARYYTVTCNSNPNTSGCKDLHGNSIQPNFRHKPSRTAVDYNFDVWVANRSFEGQASATKIANDLSDCIDRNNNSIIDTSKDYNYDGIITTDCNNDGYPDRGTTTCTGSFTGTPPEFLGEDDECILFTINYGSINDVGRSICLDTGIDAGASNAWVGTNTRAINRFYKINGTNGNLDGPYNIPGGHEIYGCVVDALGILWSVALPGTIQYINTLNPTQDVGPLLTPPWTKSTFYGITIDDKNQIWLGGWTSGYVYRYAPDRSNFSSLANGTWTRIKYPSPIPITSRGIAADDRGKIWAALHSDTNGYILRIDQNIPSGDQDLSSSTDYWQTKGGVVIGVGVDFKGNIWGISYENNVASRLDVDASGNVIPPPTSLTKTVELGEKPYTYSDFTGFGLKTFTRPQGTYIYQLSCPNKQKGLWEELTWNETLPPKTSISVRIRSGNSETTFGDWIGPFNNTLVNLDSLNPNPSFYIQIEFTLKSEDKEKTPILHYFHVNHNCVEQPR